MSNLKDLKGALVAIVTPFNEDGSIDYDSFANLLQWQVESGTDGIIVCGTTGEAQGLTDEEYSELVKFTTTKIAGRIPVIAGATHASTRKVIELGRLAKSAGADGLLIATPYYVKPSQAGIYEHYKAVAGAVDLPIIIYNIQSRTGKNIETATLLKLAHELTTIAGVKESSGDISQIKNVISGRPAGFKVFSGDDYMTPAVIAAGGDGAISVFANEVPREASQMTHLYLDGKTDEADEIFNKYKRLIDLNFVGSSPDAVKTALTAMGKIKEVFRLPICAMEPAKKELLLAELKKLQLI